MDMNLVELFSALAATDINYAEELKNKGFSNFGEIADQIVEGGELNHRKVLNMMIDNSDYTRDECVNILKQILKIHNSRKLVKSDRYTLGDCSFCGNGEKVDTVENFLEKYGFDDVEAACDLLDIDPEEEVCEDCFKGWLPELNEAFYSEYDEFGIDTRTGENFPYRNQSKQIKSSHNDYNDFDWSIFLDNEGYPNSDLIDQIIRIVSWYDGEDFPYDENFDRYFDKRINKGLDKKEAMKQAARIAILDACQNVETFRNMLDAYLANHNAEESKEAIAFANYPVKEEKEPEVMFGDKYDFGPWNDVNQSKQIKSNKEETNMNDICIKDFFELQGLDSVISILPVEDVTEDDCALIQDQLNKDGDFTQINVPEEILAQAQIIYDNVEFDSVQVSLSSENYLMFKIDNPEVVEEKKEEVKLVAPEDTVVIETEDGDFLVKSKDETFIEFLDEQLGDGVGDDEQLDEIVDVIESSVKLAVCDSEFARNAGFKYCLVKSSKAVLLKNLMKHISGSF